jgi:hypothetical protein
MCLEPADDVHPCGVPQAMFPLLEPRMSPETISTDQIPDGSTTQICTGTLVVVAPMIADGNLPFPKDLSAIDTAQLGHLVREIRRKRLVSFLARSVARYVDQQRAAQQE